MGDGDGANVCNCLFQVIQLGMSIAVVVLNVKIYKKTGENPLEIYDTNEFNTTNIEGIADYLERVNYLSTLSSFKHCQCGEKIWNNICTEEQIISGCFDVSKNSDRLLRNLEDFNCDDLKSQVITKQGYSKVFDLGFNTVHKMALGLLIILCSVLASVVLSVIAEVGKVCCGEGAGLLIAPCAICIICVLLFSGLVNFILFIILMVNYYKGRTTGEFLDYYNICAGDKEKDSLIETFDKLHSLDKTMTAFVVINFIQMGLGYIQSCIGIAKKSDES